MTRVDVRPLQGFNQVEFGMNRETVRNLLGAFKEFYKTEQSENTTDDFGFCHIYYDCNNLFEAVECFSDVEIYFNDILLYPADLQDMIIKIPNLERDEEGAISFSLSIGVYAPYEEVESIMFARYGYFDYLNS